MDRLVGRLFAIWLLLIPLPIYLPLLELDYEPYYIQFSSFSLYPNQLVALILIVVALVWYRPKIDLSPLIVSVPLLLLCLLTFVGLWTAQVSGVLSAIQLGRMLIALTLFFALKAIPLNPNHLFRAVLLFLALQGIAATLQYALQDDLGLRFLGEYDVEPLPGRGSIIFGLDEYWLRSYGLAPHPNILGGFVGSALCAAIFWWDWEDQAESNWLVALAVFLGTLAVLFPFSRSAWLGTAFGLLIGFTLNFAGRARMSNLPESNDDRENGTSASPLHQVQSEQSVSLHGEGRLNLSKPRLQLAQTLNSFVIDSLRKGIPMLLALAIFWIMASDAFQARSRPLPNQTVTQSVGERELLQALAYDFVDQTSVVGIGANNFGPAMLDLPNRSDFPSIHPVHHVPLLLAAELGLFGAAIWIFLMGMPPVIVAWHLWLGHQSKWLLGCAMALVALAAGDLFDYYSWGWPHGLTWRWMWFALLAYFYVQERP